MPASPFGTQELRLSGIPITVSGTGLLINGQPLALTTGQTGNFITTGQTGGFGGGGGGSSGLFSTVTVTGSPIITGANFTGLGSIALTYVSGLIYISGTSAAGESNTASNLGAGSGWFASKVGVDLQFKSVKVTSGLGIVGTSTDLTLYVTGDYTLNSQTGNFITASQTGAFQPALGFTPLNKIGDTSTGAYTFGRVTVVQLASQIKTVTGQYTLTTGDSTVLFSGSNLTGTLPSASAASGFYFDVKNIFGSVILSGAAGQAVEGLSGYTIPLNESIRVQSNGSVWWILDAQATGSFITTAQTGAFAPAAGTGNFVTTGQTGSIVNSGNAVLLTGTQTISGAKTFASEIQVASLGNGDGTRIDLANYLLKTTDPLTTLNWQTMVLSGTWNAQGLTVGGSNVVTANQTGAFQAALGFTPLNKAGDTSTGVFTFGRVVSSSNYAAAIKTITGQYTLTTGDSTIIFSGSNLTGTLPSASTASGYYFDVKNIFGTVILSGAAGSAVDGLSGYSLPLNESIRVQSNGTVWWTLSQQATGGFALASQTGNFVTTSQTGAFAPAAGTGAFITTGQTGAFAPAAGTGVFITTGQTGAFQAALGFTPLNKAGDTSTGVFTFGRVISSSNYSSAIKTVTGQYTLTTGDSTIVFSGSNLTGTLPSASTASGYYFDVKNIFGGVILSGAAGQAVEGASGYTIPLNEAIRVQSDGSVWRILSQQATGSFITTAQTGAFAPAAGTGNFITTGQTGAFQAALGFTPLNKAGDLSTGNFGFGRISGTNLSTFIKTVTGQYTLTTGDNTIIFSGNNLTGTLPSASTVSGIYYEIKNIFGSLVLSGTQAIDGFSGVTVPLNRGVTVKSDGSVWWVISEPANQNTGSYFYSTGLSTGVLTQFITFPGTLGSSPLVIATLSSASGNDIIPCQVSGIVSSGFWISLSNTLVTGSAYTLEILAANTTQTGLFGTLVTNITTGISAITVTGATLTGSVEISGVGGTSVIVSGQNVLVSGGASTSTWSSLTWASTITWNAQANVIEDRKIVTTTGAFTLAISGLYNGWAGALKIIQANSGAYGITLPANTKVINSGNGAVSLTTGVSGAIDVIGFQYDGTNLMATIGRTFT